MGPTKAPPPPCKFRQLIDFLPEYTVVELAVTGHCDEASPSWTQSVKYLLTCLSPHLKIKTSIYVYHQSEFSWQAGVSHTGICVHLATRCYIPVVVSEAIRKKVWLKWSNKNFKACTWWNSDKDQLDKPIS